MDIEDFIKQTLAQITSAVNNNKSGGKIKYTVDYTSGVDFDLAVTTTNISSDGKELSGGLKISIVGAGATKKSSTEISQEVVSRVKFNVNLREETNQGWQ